MKASADFDSGFFYDVDCILAGSFVTITMNTTSKWCGSMCLVESDEGRKKSALALLCDFVWGKNARDVQTTTKKSGLIDTIFHSVVVVSVVLPCFSVEIIG